MKKVPGTVFRQLDLHLHTPASGDFKDRSATPREIIDAAKKRKLDAIAVTDHNAIDWVDKVRSAIKGDEIVVFPGFELNAAGGHVLAIFDPFTPLAVLETALIECGISK